MQAKIKRFGAAALTAAVFSFILAGLSAQAAVTAVTPTAGYGWTNVVLTVTADAAASGQTIAITDLAGSSVGTLSNVDLKEGTTTFNIDSAVVSTLAAGKTYVFTVDGKSASFNNFGWWTNTLFSASAETGSSEVQNGTWETTPEITSDNEYEIEEKASFNVTADQGDSAILDIQCDMNVSSYYLLDDVTNDVTGAIAGLALVTNEENVVGYQWDKSWMVLQGGENWVKADVVASTLVETSSYETRMELDYTLTPAKVRYSIRKSSSDAWTVLTFNSAEWLTATNSTPKIASVGFIGTAKVAKFDATPKTEKVMDVAGTGYTDLAAAIAAASADKGIYLFTNVSYDPSTLSANNGVAIAQNGLAVDALPHTWKISDGTKKALVIEDDTLSVVASNFVVRIGAETETSKDLAFVTLNEAFTAADGTSVVARASFSENATLSSGTVTLNLNGYTITPASAASPIITVSSADAQLTLVGADGSEISGATSEAAVKADVGGYILIDGDIAMNNTTSLLSDGGSDSVLTRIVVSNGWFQSGAINGSSNNGKIYICGGYYLTAVTYGEDGVKASGGTFQPAAASLSVPLEDDYSIAQFGYGNNPEKKEITFNSKIAPTVYNEETGDPENVIVYQATDDDCNPLGNVQVPDTWVVANATYWDETEQEYRSPESGTSEEAAIALNSKAGYTTGSGGRQMMYWECYVLGVPADPVDEELQPIATKGPYLGGKQTSDSTTIGFSLKTPDGVVRAKETGCAVQFKVTTSDASGNTLDDESCDYVNYDQTAAVPNPKTSGVRYYNLTVKIIPNN